MIGLILLLMIAVPVLEIMVFIQAGDLIGLWPTLLVVVLTAAMGTALLRHQGLAVLLKVQESLNGGRPPVAELFDGLCLFVAGLLLLTPGFLTDGVGFLLFVPPLRSLILGGLLKRLSVSLHGGSENGPGPAPQDREDIIEGDYHEVETDPEPADRPNNRLGPGPE